MAMGVNRILVGGNYPKKALPKAITIFGYAAATGSQENCLAGRFAAKSRASSGQT